MAIADLDGDGKLDIVAIDSDVNKIAVLKGNGDGTFQSPVTYDTGGVSAQSVAVGDLNGDKKPEIVVASGQLNNAGSVGVLLNNGNGTFQAAVNYSSGGLPPNSVAIGDINGDGHADIVICDNGSGLVGLLLGNGNGTLQSVISYPAPSAMSVVISDVNGDNHPDLVTGQYGNGAINVLLNDGKGGLQPVVSYAFTASSAWSVAVQDVNGDGIPDVVVASAFACPTYCKNGSVNILTGNGDGTFRSPTTYGSGGPNARSVAIGDINEDGRPDILVVNANTAMVSGLLNNLKVGMAMGLSSSANPVQVNHPFTVTAAFTSELPVDGKVVSFYIGGVLAGTGTTKNGVATFTTTISQARTHTIKVTYPGGPFQKPISGSYKQGVVP
jgi:hypothetical protein